MVRRYRKRRRTRRPGGFGRFMRGVGQVAGVASKALQIANQVKGLINVEIKQFNGSGTSSVSSAGTVIPLSNIAQGDDDGERDGRSIKGVNLSLKAYLTHNSSGLAEQIVRVMIVTDRAPQGTAPAVTDVLASANVIAHRNLAYAKQIHVLHDSLLTVNESDDYKMFNRFIKRNMKIDYTGTAAAHYGDGNLFLVLVSNEASVNYPDFIYNFRLRYVDN